MSYSFAVVGLTKAAALAAATARLDEEIVRQPIHTKDRAEALANVEKHLALVRDPKEGEQVGVSMHGSCWGATNDAGEVELRGAGSGCSISIDTIPVTA